MKNFLNKIILKFKKRHIDNSKREDILTMIGGHYECKINGLEEKLDEKNNELLELMDWLKGEKYGYFLEDHKTWVNYGELTDKFPYNEEDKQWELSRNRMITKTIDKIKTMI